MSKKKTLSPTASLASCLDFAARVLSSTATVQELCTKQVLAPMVVEAHRCGQQVMKHVDSGIPADVRKLIKVLQSEKGSNLCRGSPLEELEVADLTWDAEGNVADTLEMELVELEKRVVDAQDACIILSASGGNDQAVIWFSFKRYESLHKGSGPKNRQILLYVCPGRVKVVKSVDALITKLYEELAPLRMNGATYSVWTVVMGSKSSNQKEEQRVDPVAPQKTHYGTSNQFADEDEFNTLNTRTTVAPEPLSCERISHLDEIARSTESRRSNITLCNQETGVGPQLCVTKESVETAPESQDDKCGRVFPHCSVYRDTSDTKPFPVKSIFSFGLQQRTSQELQRSSFEQKSSCINAADENEKGIVVFHPDSVNMEGEKVSGPNPEVEVESRGDNQIQDTRSIRAVVSSSLTNFTALANGSVPDDTALGFGIKLKKGFVWQSCDGKVLRKTVRPQQLPLASAEATESEVQVEVEAAKHEEQPDAHTGDNEELAHCTIDDLISGEKQKPQDMTQGTPSKVDSVDGKLDSLHISTFLHKPNVHQDHDDNQPVGSSQKSEVVMQTTSFVAASAKSASPDSGTVNDESINDGMGEPLQTDELLAGHVGVCDKTEEHSIAPSEIHEENNEDSMHRPKSAVNYKDKLGARIWWELAYTARRLEREEMMEKHQPLRLVGDQRVNQQQPATTNARRVEPTQSRKEELVGPHKELTLDDPSCIDQQSPREVDTMERQSPNNYLDAPERSLDSSSATSASTIKKEISLSRIAMATPSRESLSGSSVDAADEFVTSRPLSVQNVLDSGTIAMQEEVEEGVVQCPPITISPVASWPPIRETYGSLDQRRESNSAMRESSTPSLVQLSTSSSLATRIEEEDNEDEMVAQMMWGSTHTSYERERQTNVYPAAKEDEPQTTEAMSKIPFSIRGRVPIRSRQVEYPSRDEPPRSSCAELAPPSSNFDLIAGAEQSQYKQIPSRIKLPAYQASTDHKTQPVVPAPPPVATFIPLGEENTAITSGKTRQERLNDLRQKKLQKLQQARDSSLQLQKEKQSQQTRQPLSFANAIYTKKASNRQLMQNALEFTLLAGGSMEKERMLALQALVESTCDNFIVLLKSAKELKFRALYENHVDRDYATRIYSVLPNTSARAPLKLANSEMISQFFKYSSAKKQFLPVPTRSFTVKTDACALVDQLVFKKNSSSALARLL